MQDAALCRPWTEGAADTTGHTESAARRPPRRRQVRRRSQIRRDRRDRRRCNRPQSARNIWAQSARNLGAISHSNWTCLNGVSRGLDPNPRANEIGANTVQFCVRLILLPTIYPLMSPTHNEN